MKQTTIIIMIAAVFLFRPLSVAAQKGNQLPEIVSSFEEPPLVASAPLFYKLIKNGETSIKKIDEAYEEYDLARGKKEKSILKVGEDEEEFEDGDPYAKYYKKWRRGIEDYITPDGMIKTFSEAEMKTLYQRMSEKVSTQSKPKSLQQRTAKAVASTTWSLVGPVDTYFRKNDNGGNQTKAPWQVNVYTFAVAPSDPNILYCGTETGGLFKSTDKGLNWVSVSSNYNFVASSTSLVVHPTDPNTVYASIARNIFKTTDGGITWNSVYYNSSASVDAVTMIINPNDPLMVYAASANGLLKTTNGGVNWATVFTQKTYDVEFKPGDTNTIYAVRLNGTIVEFVKSIDGGTTFTVSNTGWPTGVTNASGALIAVTPANPDVVYAAWLVNEAAANGKKPRFMKSTDGGANWTTYAIDALAGSFDPTNGQGFYDFILTASPNDANKVLLGLTNLYRTDNGGTSFIAVGGYNGSFNIHPDTQCAVAIGNDTWVTTDGGVNYSSDFFTSTSNYESRTNGIYATEFWGFSQGWNEDIMVGGRYHNGNTAISEQYPYNKALRLGGGEDPTGFLYPGQPRRASFSDIGTSILPQNFSDLVVGQSNISKYPTMDGYGYDYSNLLIHPNYFKTIYMGQGNTLWKSEDNGSSFTAVKTFPLKVRRFEISRSNPNYIYLATESYLYKSTDAGVTFTQIDPTIGSGDWLIAINAFNENQAWFVKRNGANGSKVYKTTDGGLTTSNITSTVLDNRKVRAIAFDGGNPGSIYIAASPDFSATPSGVMAGSKVFYYNNDTSGWDDYSDGLPANFKVLRMFPFFRDGKLRMAGNMGVWEVSLKNPSVPQVQPIASANLIKCSRDIVQFDDYSILNHAGASWQWSFNPAPTWIDDANIRNPRATFTTPGNYDVTLTVTTPSGSASKTITSMITVDPVSICTDFDTTAGKALDPQGNTVKAYASTNTGLGVTTNTFTISAWVRPKGTQSSFAGIVHTSTNSTIVGNKTIALNFKNNNELGYHWPRLTGETSNWNISSGLTVPADKWSHVAVVVEPAKVTFYLNGIAVEKSTVNYPILLDNVLSIGTMAGSESARTMNGAIDEVCMWNRALTKTEIRELRHLTKNATNTSNLLAYYQFNEASGSTVFDKVGGKDVVISGNGRVVSTAPVGGGVSASQSITAAGTYTFGTTGASLTTTDSGPNGEVWATRINQNPDAQPDVNSSGSQYWIFNNYGTAASFNALTDLSLSNVSQVNATTATDLSKFNLYQRTENGDGSTWGQPKGHPVTANEGSKTVSFDNGSTITSSSQFAVTYGTPTAVPTVSLVDALPGNALACNGTSDPKFAITETLGLENNNTFSMSAWIKPTGYQTTNSTGILLCRSGGNTGLTIKYSNGKNYLGFSWNDMASTYNTITPLEILPNQWSHVAMTVSPTLITVYVNGKSYTLPGTYGQIDFREGFAIGADARSSYNNSRNFLGLIDEVCFWNKTLTTDEVRASRHLIKEASTPNLVGYYQFNELNGDAIDDKVSSKNAYTVNGAQLSVSTVPVGRGFSAKQVVGAAGTYSYATPGVDITFGTNTPNGDVWISRINNSPDQKPSSFDDGSRYWIVNNYGNTSFDPLVSIKFYGTGLVTSSNEASSSQFSIFKRADNADGATWSSIGTASNASMSDNNSVTFPGNAINSFSQFSLSSQNTSLAVPLFNFKMGVEVYPNPVQTNGIIDFSIPQDGKVDVDIVNISGQVLQRVVSRYLNSGRTAVDFNTNNLPSGFYFLRIRVDGQDQFIKKIIVK